MPEATLENLLHYAEWVKRECDNTPVVILNLLVEMAHRIEWLEEQVKP